MMNFEDFLKKVEESKYKKDFIIEDIHSDNYSHVCFRLTLSFMDKNVYIDEDSDDPVYTEERYEEGYKNWIGDEWNDGLIIDKFLNHYGIDKGYDINYELNFSGEVVWVDIFWESIFRTEEDYNKIIQVFKNFSKDYNVNDYNVIDGNDKKDTSINISFYENKNDDFDTSIFNGMVNIESWIF